VKLIAFVMYDESTFNSNDGRKCIWIHEDKSPLQKKCRGHELHVLDYLTPIGRLRGGQVCEILKCGGDTWWPGEDILQQLVDKAIPAFERSFPRCQGLFAFDNAKSHQKYTADAFRTGNMNLTLGGKKYCPYARWMVCYKFQSWHKKKAVNDATRWKVERIEDCIPGVRPLVSRL